MSGKYTTVGRIEGREKEDVAEICTLSETLEQEHKLDEKRSERNEPSQWFKRTADHPQTWTARDGQDALDFIT